MFDQIQNKLFPNLCQIYKINNEKFLYPIFKNASSLINKKAKNQNWPIFTNEQIKKCKVIEVYFRHPIDRYKSGVNSYINILQNKNLYMDADTILKMIYDYPFLDRHFCPQYFWICNLSRYMSLDSTIIIKPLKEIQNIVGKEYKSPFENKNYNIEISKEIEKFLNLDIIIMNYFLNKPTNISQINQYLKQKHSISYKEIFGTALQILSQHEMS